MKIVELCVNCFDDLPLSDGTVQYSSPSAPVTLNVCNNATIMVTLAFVGGLFFIVLLLLILWIVGLAFIVLHPRFNRPRTNENPATTPTATAKPSGTPVVDIELAHRQQQLTGRILKTSSCIVVDYGGVIEGETSPSFV